MSSVLQLDVYYLKAPGVTIDKVKQPDPDPLAALEALSLLESVSEGIVMIQKLEALLLNESPTLRVFIHDVTRFTIFTRSIIEQAPLQFSPQRKASFGKHSRAISHPGFTKSPEWKHIRVRYYKSSRAILNLLPLSPSLPTDAATGQQLLPALEGHTSYITSIAFSPDGKQIVSGSDDQTVRR
ncbi:uncharacterized protein RAG0_02869 [Rhynchosporium agropyri]|uniref:Uncharacterized protein n=1 Tax=Rhynchosporium agropyri TaxID=914238 RepID=A0A1E1K753_9HELO|nr:uncharacterized protein RAG0_02869 [Rhynchosporium agropyri]